MNGDFLLWWHQDYNGTLSEKIKKAVGFFQAKYGRAPEVVELSPQEMELIEEWERLRNLIIRQNVLVVPGYLFVGMEEQ